MKPVDLAKKLRREAAFEPAVLDRGKVALMAAIRQEVQSMRRPTIIPRLPYENVGAALSFLERAFGFREVPAARGVRADGAIDYTMVEFGDGMIGLGAQGAHGAFSPKRAGTATQYLTVHVDDIDAHHQRALASGAEIVSRLHDHLRDYRVYEALDLEGHRWRFLQSAARGAVEMNTGEDTGMNATKGLVVPAGGGTYLDMMAPGRFATLKLLGHETNGSVMLFEETIPAGTKSLFHLHRDSDEVAWVLAGEITFQIGDEVRVGGPGTCAFFPRNVPHAWKNTGQETSRAVFFYTPAAAGGYVEELLHRPRPMNDDATQGAPRALPVGGHRPKPALNSLEAGQYRPPSLRWSQLTTFSGTILSTTRFGALANAPGWTGAPLACVPARASNASLTLVSSSRTSQRPRIITPRSSAYSSPASIINATLGFRRILTTFCAFPYEVM